MTTPKIRNLPLSLILIFFKDTCIISVLGIDDFLLDLFRLLVLFLFVSQILIYFFLCSDRSYKKHLDCIIDFNIRMQAVHSES